MPIGIAQLCGSGVAHVAMDVPQSPHVYRIEALEVPSTQNINMEVESEPADDEGLEEVQFVPHRNQGGAVQLEGERGVCGERLADMR